MDSEKRKYVRFLAQETAFAALRSGFKKVGKVHDISIKGLAFSYMDKAEELLSDSDSTNVDIFTSENGFHLANVPCKVVYDTETSLFTSIDTIRTNRCGLQFGELPGSQAEQLEYFLKNHTTGIAP